MTNLSSDLVAILTALAGIGFFIGRAKYYKAKSDKNQVKAKLNQAQVKAWEDSAQQEQETNDEITQKSIEVGAINNIGDLIIRHVERVRAAKAKRGKNTDTK